MQFGKEEIITQLDDEGSTVTEERHIVNFKTNYPVRKRYERKVRVKDKKEEMTEYLKFSDSLDGTKKDPSFRIESSKHGEENGYYYIVKCWTELVYED